MVDDIYGRSGFSVNEAEAAQTKKIAAYRDEQLAAAAALRPGTLSAVRRTIWVQPSGNGPVPNLSGGYFPNEPMEVQVSDIFITRRIRDGSLVVVGRPASADVIAPEVPAPAPEETLVPSPAVSESLAVSEASTPAPEDTLLPGTAPEKSRAVDKKSFL